MTYRPLLGGGTGGQGGSFKISSQPPLYRKVYLTRRRPIHFCQAYDTAGWRSKDILYIIMATYLLWCTGTSPVDLGLGLTPPADSSLGSQQQVDSEAFSPPILRESTFEAIAATAFAWLVDRPCKFSRRGRERIYHACIARPPACVQEDVVTKGQSSMVTLN